MLDDAEAFGSFLGQYYAVPDRVVPGEVLLALEPADADALRDWLERARRPPRRRCACRSAARCASWSRWRTPTPSCNSRSASTRAPASSATLAELQERLGARAAPAPHRVLRRLDAGGTLAVASRVAFDDGRPDKNGYRRYRIREAAAGDDFACLREVLTRRLAKRESDPLPDLLMVDGGKGQLGVAVAALRDAGVALDAIGISKERDVGGDTRRVRATAASRRSSFTCRHARTQ